MTDDTQNTPRDYSEPLVPEGKRPTQLTVGEVGYASRAAGFNLMVAFGDEDDPRQPLAWAYIALMWAKRRYPDAVVEDFTDMEYSELFRVLRISEPAEDDEGAEDPEDPTQHAPA